MLTYAELQDIRDRHAVALSLPAGAEAMRLLATYAIPTLFSHIADQAEALKAEKEQSVRLFGHNGDLAAENHQLRSQLQQVQAEVAAVRQRAKEGLERKQGELEELRRLFRAYINMRDSNSMSWAFMAEVQEALKEGE